MISPEIKPESRHESKTRFLDAVLHAFRSKGYSAPRIEDICEAAGLTEGSFFHHFGSKDELALEAAKYWTEGTDALFASAPYGNHADPLDSLPAYMDFRKSLMRGELSNFTCLIGTLVQEDYETHPAIRTPAIGESASRLQRRYPTLKRPSGEVESKGSGQRKALRFCPQATIPGAFILAKAARAAAIAAQCIDHLRRYLEILLLNPGKRWFEPLPSSE